MENITLREQRQIDILKKYHEVDEVNKTIKVKLHYEKASDIVSNDLSSDSTPIFDSTIIDKIHDILNRFPPEYTLDLELCIDDYEGHDPKQLLDSLCDTLELEQYRTVRKVKKTWLLSLLLLFIGVGLLIVLSVLKRLGVIGDETLSDMILDYVLDTVACVFIWEFISTLCLYPAEFVVTNTEVFRGFNSISFFDEKGNIQCSITKKEILSTWVVDSKKEHVGKIFLIATGGIHVILGVIGLTNFFTELHTVVFDQGKIVMTIVITIIVSILQIIYGIGSISRFNDKGPFKKLVFVLSFLLIIAYGFSLASIIINAVSGTRISAASVVSFGAGLTFTVLNLIGCFWTRDKYVKDNKAKLNKVK